MYLVLVLEAIFKPRKTANKISCTHEGTTDHALIDLGRNKVWWCSSCEATWFATGHAS